MALAYQRLLALAMPRFVVLEHHWEGVHWDFMLEADGVLRTWALAEEPDARSPQAARQLFDHRLRYLDYEGPISRNRGHVRRWDRGTYEVLQWSEQQVRVQLCGQRLRGIAHLQRLSAESWEFRFSATDRAPSAS